MKIAFISPSQSHLQQVLGVLGADGHEVLLYEGGKSRMNEIARQHELELMLVDGMCREGSELAQVEQLTLAHPQLAVVLMCASHTPDFLLGAMRVGVREVLPSPASTQALRAAVARVQARRVGEDGGRKQGKVVGFVPCKGGAGATFLATHVAAALAQERSVLLIDLNLQFGGALAFMHDGRPAATLADVAKDIHRLDGTLLAASTVKVGEQLSVLAAPEDLGHALEVQPEHVDAILAQAISQYEVVVLDLPRALDPLVIKAMDRCWRLYPVLQAALPDLRNAARLLQAFQSLGYAGEKTEFILNRHEKSAELGLEQAQRALGMARLRTVPNAWREVSSAINHGDLLTRQARGGALSRALTDLAQAICPTQEASRSLMDRFFRRA